MRWRVILLSAAGILFCEILLRILPPAGVLRRHTEKLSHCREEGFLAFCPGVSMTVYGPHFSFRLTTNERGERITESAGKSDGRDVWLFGDSIMTGYGLDDEASAPFRIAAAGYSVRNFAVDGLGVRGSRRRFEAALKTARPRRAYFLFDYSDFQDAERESRASSALLQTAWKLDRLLSHSYLYCALFASRPVNQAAPETAPAQNLEGHPALAEFRQFAALSRSAGVDFVLLVYAGGGLDGMPGPGQSYQDLVAGAARLEKIPVLDFRKRFLDRARTETLYIPGDGHPSRAGAALLADAILEDLKSRPLSP